MIVHAHVAIGVRTEVCGTIGTFVKVQIAIVYVN